MLLCFHLRCGTFTWRPFMGVWTWRGGWINGLDTVGTGSPQITLAINWTESVVSKGDELAARGHGHSAGCGHGPGRGYRGGHALTAGGALL